MSLLFNMLSRLITAFLPRSKHLLISWLQTSRWGIRPARLSVTERRETDGINNIVPVKETDKGTAGLRTNGLSLEGSIVLQKYIRLKCISPVTFLLLLAFGVVHKSYNSNCFSEQLSSVSQSCPTLCNPMNHSTPGFPVHVPHEARIIQPEIR